MTPQVRRKQAFQDLGRFRTSSPGPMPPLSLSMLPEEIQSIIFNFVVPPWSAVLSDNHKSFSSRYELQHFATADKTIEPSRPLRYDLVRQSTRGSHSWLNIMLTDRRMYNRIKGLALHRFTGHLHVKCGMILKDATDWHSGISCSCKGHEERQQMIRQLLGPLLPMITSIQFDAPYFETFDQIFTRILPSLVHMMVRTTADSVPFTTTMAARIRDGSQEEQMMAVDEQKLIAFRDLHPYWVQAEHGSSYSKVEELNLGHLWNNEVTPLLLKEIVCADVAFIVVYSLSRSKKPIVIGRYLKEQWEGIEGSDQILVNGGSGELNLCIKGMHRKYGRTVNCGSGISS